MKKEDLLKIIKSPAGKLVAVDLDGTLCEGEFWGEGEPIPKADMVQLIRDMYIKGAHIIIYTARQPKYYSDTLSWLIKHNVPFHGISMFVKCGADIYIDDKSLNTDDVV